MEKFKQMVSSFHDYDIRGVYPVDLDEDFYYQLGKAVAKYVGKGPIGVGHDARISSSALTKALIEGITDMGLDVVFIGLVSTENHNYASGTGKYEANVMVSASHNPKQYNGAKIALKGAVPLHGGFGLPELKVLMLEEIPNAVVKGIVTEENLFEQFIENSLSQVDVTSFRKLKVVVDAGNGMGGPVWQRMMETLPLEIIPLFLEPDGNFPNHEGDPLQNQNVIDLKAKILETGADLGIALDGDADRVFFFDEKAQRQSGTITMALFIDHFIRAQKSIGTYLYDVRIGRVVPQLIKTYGGKAIKTRVGHSFIKAKMREFDGIFGGEASGHFYFKDNFNAECTLTAGLMIIEMLSKSNKSFSEMSSQFDIYPQSGEINFELKDKSLMLSVIKDVYSSEAESVEEIDGIVFNFNDWWFGVRFSNTAVPLLRLNLEADNQELMNEKLNEVIALIQKNSGVRK